MEIEWTLQRRATSTTWMFGDLDCAGVYSCRTLEDELREQKLMHETAIPAGRYELEFVDSPRFGPQSIGLLDVAGFTNILIHAGNRDTDTSGCIIVGDKIDEIAGQISGGTARKILARLKRELQAAIENDDRVFLVIRNAPGDRFVDSGHVAKAKEIG